MDVDPHRALAAIRHEYARALARQLAAPDDANLQAAYELGTRALDSGLSLGAVIAIHHQALAELTIAARAQVPKLVAVSQQMLLELLAPLDLQLTRAHHQKQADSALIDELKAQVKRLAPGTPRDSAPTQAVAAYAIDEAWLDERRAHLGDDQFTREVERFITESTSHLQELRRAIDSGNPGLGVELASALARIAEPFARASSGDGSARSPELLTRVLGEITRMDRDAFVREAVVKVAQAQREHKQLVALLRQFRQARGLADRQEMRDREMMAEALWESEDRYRNLYNDTPIMMHSIDRDGRLLNVNEFWLKTLGYTRREVIGRRSTEFLTEQSRRYATEVIIPAFFDTGVCTDVPYQFVKKTGELIDVLLSASAERNAHGEIEYSVSVIRDITEQKRAAEQLRNSLREKDVLLKEIHHRVKNNLQIISSLLDLQSSYVDDPTMRSYAKDSQSRIKSMALVHEKLYQSRDLASIDFADYIDSVISHLMQSYAGTTRAIAVTLDIPSTAITVDSAIPCGLIINELVSNAVKHAFPPGFARAPQVAVQLCADDGDDVILMVTDNGVGLPDGVCVRDTPSLGLTLVKTLVKQLKGEFELHTASGTQARMRFPPSTAGVSTAPHE